MNKAKIGLIGIVHQELERDLWGTLKTISDIGYQGLEGAEFLLKGDVTSNVKRFEDLGLKVLTVTAGMDDLSTKLDALIQKAHTLKSTRATVWWAACNSREQTLRDAEILNKAGAVLAKEGVRLCYHNHEQEFLNRFNGVYAMDLLAEYTDPSALSFELDIAWVTFGREDPVNVIHKYGTRIAALHLKDLWSTEKRGHFTAVGTGIVKIKESIHAALDNKIEWVVVEQDALRNLTPMETITVSYLNLKEAGLV